MKKRLIVSLVLLSWLGGWSAAQSEGPLPLKLGMVTDSGTVTDQSFNQATWEGLQRAKGDLHAEVAYLRPAGTTAADYLARIRDLHDAGYQWIVTPGFKFETAVFLAQDRYQNTKFVLIDGSPNNGRYDGGWESRVGPNTVAVFFAEEQAGFLAGVAAAVQVGQGAFGFIGGMEIPPVQRYNWGFQQGVQYANRTWGTKITMDANDIVYQGTFSDVAAGQQLASQFYDRGVKVIFAAAGGVGIGVLLEAKARAASGVWVVGVDVDQFHQGEYKPGKSVVLTSAMVRVDTATYLAAQAFAEGRFPGGQTLVLDILTDGVGIPRTNPNLGPQALQAVNDATAAVKDGKVKVFAQAAFGPDQSR
jgi:basic membrane protein A